MEFLLASKSTKIAKDFFEPGPIESAAEFDLHRR
jgi:hypothetical protein